MPVKAAIGCLLWVAGNTRPDVVNPIRAIARHSHNPSPRHWKGLRKIMGYLKGTRDLGTVFRRGGGLKLSLYVDADGLFQVLRLCWGGIGRERYQHDATLHHTVD